MNINFPVVHSQVIPGRSLLYKYMFSLGPTPHRFHVTNLSVVMFKLTGGVLNVKVVCACLCICLSCMAVYYWSSACRLPKRWTQWKAMFLTMSSRSFRWVWIKSLTVVSRSSFTFSDIPENIKLSLILQAWSLMTVSLILFIFFREWGNSQFLWGWRFQQQELHRLTQCLKILTEDFQEGQTCIKAVQFFIYGC